MMSGMGLEYSSPEAFVRTFAPYARLVGVATDIPPEALIAMACHESDFGRRCELTRNDLFGVGQGEADYGSPVESLVAFADLVTTSPRYRGALGQTTVIGFVEGLRLGGYVTDVNYAARVEDIAAQYASVIRHALAQPAGSAESSVSASSPDAVLTRDESLAACGEAATSAFVKVFGRLPSRTEASDLAAHINYRPRAADGPAASPAAPVSAPVSDAVSAPVSAPVPVPVSAPVSEPVSDVVDLPTIVQPL